MSIDLTQLPPPDVLDYPNFEALLSERKAALIAACPEAIRATIAATLELESEPLTIDLEQSVYREYLLRERINTAVKATFLATATGADLDQFAAGRNIERKIIQAADPDAMPPVEAILESDAALRLRCQLFPEKLAAAGPRNTYYAHALDADTDVADAQVVNADSGLVPAGTVRVYIKSHTTAVADDHFVSVVYDYLSADTRRPLCDTVEVRAATQLAVVIEWANEYETGPDKTVVFANQQAAITALIAKNGNIGAEMSLSKIIGALDVEGVKKVTLTKPTADVVSGFGRYPVYTLKAPTL